MTLRRPAIVLAVLSVCLVGSVGLDVGVGAVVLSPARLLAALGDVSARSQDAMIVWNLRLPMSLLAAFTGMALGLGGAEMQTVLDNPLASPFTLGVSAAAAFGASLAIVLGWRLPLPGLSGEWTIVANAFALAVGSTLLLDFVVRVRGAAMQTVALLGVALVFAFQALVSLLQFLASEDTLQDLVFWTLGSVTRANWPKVATLCAALIAALSWALRDSWALTALRLGQERAEGLGVNVARLRLRALMRVSVLAALAVAFSGTIGFVGLIAPHIARRLVGEDHRHYLPASLLVGGAILSLAATLSRIIVAGEVVPVGIVTALVGIPVFLTIILRDTASE